MKGREGVLSFQSSSPHLISTILAPNFSLKMGPMAALRHAPVARAAQFRALAVSCGIGSPETAAKAAAVPPVSKKLAPGVLIGMSESDLQQLALEFGQVRFELEVHNLILLFFRVDELIVVF